MKNKRTKSVP